MKKNLLPILILLYLKVAVTHADVTSGDCSPIIKDVSGTAKVTVNCTNKTLEEKINNLPSMPEFNNVLKEQAKLRKVNAKLELLLQNLQGDADEKERKLKSLRSSIRANKAKLQSIEPSIDQLSEKISNEFSRIEEFATESVINIKRQFQTALKKEIEKIYDSIKQEIQALEQRATNAEAELEKLAERVDEMDKKIDKLKIFFEGESEHIILFVGANAGGLYIDDEWQIKYGLEIDTLLPTTKLIKRSSAFVEFVQVDWDKTLSFPTLPGTPDQTFLEDNSFTYIGGGGKVFFPIIQKNYLVYTGASVGSSTSGEKTMYYGFLFGAELFLQTSRIGVELRYDWMPSIKEKTFTFNPFGNAETGIRESNKNGYYIGIKILFRT